ncbi:MAG: ribosome rescue protein RqcH [Thermoplasmata archaeon]
MKVEGLTSPDINAWIIENREYLLDSFIKKYEIGDIIKIRFHKKDVGNRDLYIELPRFIYFGERYEMESKENQAFENIVDRKVISIDQPNFDRIIRIDLSFSYSIIIELFSQGNFIILKDNKIEYANIYREWKGRKIFKGEEYRYPPSPYDPRNLDIKKFKEILKNDTDIVRFLALKLNFSHYSENILKNCNIDKNKICKDLQENEIECIYENMNDILRYKDKYYLCNNKISIFNENNCEEYTKINDAILNLAKIKDEGDEINRIINEQMKTMEEYKKYSEKMKNEADLIMMNIGKIDEIINDVKRNKIRNELLSRNGKIIKILLDGNEIDLDILKNAIMNAQEKYEESKKYAEKINGILSAIEKIKNKKIEKEEKKIIVENRKRFWFEKYRWFISSENAIVIAGRDAKTNEEVVKKYLEEKDYYVHADIHGAPSVVVKNTGITRKTLIEAGIFSVSFSKAWNAGYKSADAYWVTFSQVSKMAESGEYVPRGAWVIRGKKNYMRNLPLKLGIGEIEYQNVKIVMIGPIESFKNKTKKIIVISQGETRKDVAAAEISKRFGISIDEAMKLLPPGNVNIEGELDVSNIDNSHSQE